MLDVVGHACNGSSQEAEMRGSFVSKPEWATWQIKSQLGLYGKVLSGKQNNRLWPFGTRLKEYLCPSSM